MPPPESLPDDPLLSDCSVCLRMNMQAHLHPEFERHPYLKKLVEREKGREGSPEHFTLIFLSDLREERRKALRPTRERSDPNRFQAALEPSEHRPP